jgi:uncharacterized protein (DUF2236 family)
MRNFIELTEQEKRMFQAALTSKYRELEKMADEEREKNGFTEYWSSLLNKIEEHKSVIQDLYK